MQRIPRHRVRSHADFDLTPLGMWAYRRDVATLMPAARHVQRLTCLPNPFAALHGLDETRESVGLHLPWRQHDEPA